MSRYISAGIDIGSHTTRVVIAEIDKKQAASIPHITGTGSSESRGVRHGYIVNNSDVSKSIRNALLKAEKEAGVKVKRALISIGGISLESETTNGSIMVSRIDGEISETDVTNVMGASEGNLKLANKTVVLRVPLSFKIDGKEVLGRPAGMRGVKIEARIVFVTCLSQHLEDLIKTIESLGVEVEDVVPSPVAASLVTLSKAQRTAGCVLANIGAETVSLAVFENDQLLSLEVFPIGSTDITNDIALGFKVPLEEAEQMKIGSSENNYPGKELNEIIEARLSDIFELIQTHLKKRGRNELLPAGIVITGGGSGVATIEDLARASLKLPAKVAVPRSFYSKEKEELETVWSVAYGLCLLGFNKSFQSDLFQKTSDPIAGTVRKAAVWVKQFFP